MLFLKFLTVLFISYINNLFIIYPKFYKNLGYMWNYGSLSGICLVIQFFFTIITGIKINILFMLVTFFLLNVIPWVKMSSWAAIVITHLLTVTLKKKFLDHFFKINLCF